MRAWRPWRGVGWQKPCQARRYVACFVYGFLSCVFDVFPGEMRVQLLTSGVAALINGAALEWEPVAQRRLAAEPYKWHVVYYIIFGGIYVKWQLFRPQSRAGSWLWFRGLTSSVFLYPGYMRSGSVKSLRSSRYFESMSPKPLVAGIVTVWRKQVLVNPCGFEPPPPPASLFGGS